jgi:hypothetical protein
MFRLSIFTGVADFTTSDNSPAGAGFAPADDFLMGVLTTGTGFAPAAPFLMGVLATGAGFAPAAPFL